VADLRAEPQTREDADNGIECLGMLQCFTASFPEGMIFDEIE
jgi:hypothetical protein